MFKAGALVSRAELPVVRIAHDDGELCGVRVPFRCNGHPVRNKRESRDITEETYFAKTYSANLVWTILDGEQEENLILGKA